ncbi:methylthioribulose 1-phosphate dehydratase [Pistricoccus aurantiacus]|uniref:methylthioribulose 1-phosphate dehydratase n=1 Tax=Pistricoccus aurantiacus TaxID=1883414 RepID=UPI00363AB3D6
MRTSWSRIWRRYTLEPHRKPSAEALLHGRLYADQSRTGAVLHTHSKAATLLSLIEPGKTLWLSGYELLKALEGVASHDERVAIPIFDNTQDMRALADQAGERLAHEASVAYLIRGHGLYTWATDMKACLRQVEALDFLFDCELFLRR